MTPHSPAPWRIVEHSWSHTSIVDATGRTVATLSIEDETAGGKQHLQDALEAQMAADSYHIARACSCFDEMLAALRRIEKWFGEFPESKPMSYGMAFGSNGERDYMRGIARAALDKATADHQE